jgi:hypothetical protein
MRRTLTVAVIAALLAAGLSGCRIDAAKAKAFITRDGKVVLEPAPKSKGETIFRIENNSPAKRQVVLVELDDGQDPAALPVDSRGIVPTGKPSDIEHRGDGYRVVEKLDSMRPYYGGDARIVTTMHTYLRAGRYVLLSNLPGDYGKGLWTTFTVGASA